MNRPAASGGASTNWRIFGQQSGSKRTADPIEPMQPLMAQTKAEALRALSLSARQFPAIVSQRDSHSATIIDRAAATGSKTGVGRLNLDETASQHFARIHRAALVLCGNPWDADDLAQETFLVLSRQGAAFGMSSCWRAGRSASSSPTWR